MGNFPKKEKQCVRKTNSNNLNFNTFLLFLAVRRRLLVTKVIFNQILRKILVRYSPTAFRYKIKNYMDNLFANMYLLVNETNR